MRTIKLLSLSMVGFRGATEQTTEFSPKETIISGGNGTGKSRHFDAFLWLIFGKDARGRKDEGIKTYDRDGNTTDKAPCEVSAVLEVTDDDQTERLELRRAFVEDWVKPRGQTEEVMRGNHTECWWNGLPVNVTEYTKRINAIIDETTFKLLTNPEYFPSLNWQDQRKILYMVADTPSIEEIAKQSDKWMELIRNLGGKSLADYKKELAVKRRKLTEDGHKIPQKVEGILMGLHQVNWAKNELEEELAQIDRDNEEIDKALASIAERSRQVNAERAKKEDQVEELRRQQRRLISEEKTRAEEATYANGESRRELESEIRRKEREKADYEYNIKKAKAQINDVNSNVEKLEKKVKDIRTSWLERYKSQYSGETTCPHCHQELPPEQTQKAHEIWERLKGESLEALKGQGERAKQDLEDYKARAKELGGELDENQKKAEAIGEEIERDKEKLEAMPEADVVEPRPSEELEGYAELEEEIKKLSEELKSEVDKPESTEDYTARRKKLTARRDEIKAQLSKQEERERLIKKKRDLEDEGRKIAQLIADIELEENVANELTNRQVEESERKVNTLFHGVTFQLFEYTIEDKNKEYPIETCKMLVNGVPFGVVNYASQVNAGLEVIRVFSEYHEVYAPIFVDNEESVRRVKDDLQTQMIKLRVTDDKELVITHNN